MNVSLMIFVAFTAGFLVACAIFRTRRPPKTQEEVQAAALERLHQIATELLEQPLTYEDPSSYEQRMTNHQVAMKAIRELMASQASPKSDYIPQPLLPDLALSPYFISSSPRLEKPRRETPSQETF